MATGSEFTITDNDGDTLRFSFTKSGHAYVSITGAGQNVVVSKDDLEILFNELKNNLYPNGEGDWVVVNSSGEIAERFTNRVDADTSLTNYPRNYVVEYDPS